MTTLDAHERKKKRDRDRKRHLYATDPEYRKKQLEIQRKRYATDPEYRRKKLEDRKKYRQEARQEVRQRSQNCIKIDTEFSEAEHEGKYESESTESECPYFIGDLDDGRVIFCSSYNREFILEARKMNGRFNRQDSAWIFDIEHLEALQRIAENIWGKENEDQVCIKIKALRRLTTPESGIFFGHRTVCYANGKYPGAKLGEGVESVPDTGIIGNYGYKRNGTWRVFVDKGTEFLMNIAASKVDALEYADTDWTVEIQQVEEADTEYGMEDASA